MAYAYPSGGDANASSASLVHSSPVKSTASTRKGSDDKFDVLREFKASSVTPRKSRTALTAGKD